MPKMPILAARALLVLLLATVAAAEIDVASPVARANPVWIPRLRLRQRLEETTGQCRPPLRPRLKHSQPQPRRPTLRRDPAGEW